MSPRAFAWLRSRLRSMRCSSRHDWLIQFAPSRVYLQCQTCGRETPGWTLLETPPTRSEWSINTVRRRVLG